MAVHRGYSSEHCWYYYLGGRILRLSEIRAEAIASGYRGYCEAEIDRIDRLPAEKRSRAIRDMRKRFEKTALEDAKRYRQVAARVRYRRHWLGPYPDEHRDMCNEPCMGLSLKHNHLFNDFAILHALDKLGEIQMELF